MQAHKNQQLTKYKQQEELLDRDGKLYEKSELVVTIIEAQNVEFS